MTDRDGQQLMAVQYRMLFTETGDMQADITSLDERDRNLFQVDDARLRAAALRHSILPRLYAAVEETTVVSVIVNGIRRAAPDIRSR